MAKKSYPSERPGVEQIGPNTYRIGYLLTVKGPDGKSRRQWLRETHTYPDTMTHAQQLDMAVADRERLRQRSQRADDLHVDLHRMPDPSALTVGQLVQLWQDTVLPVRSADYRKTAKSLIALHILPHLSHTVAAELTPLQISNWIALLSTAPSRRTGKPLSKTTTRHVYITLSTIYNWAKEQELLKASPFDRTHAPKARKHKPKFLDDDQGVQLLAKLATVENMSFRAAVLLALMCGLRLSEVDAITWDCVNWRQGTIDISKAVHQTPETGRIVGDTKSDDSLRIIHAPAALLALLDETKHYQEDNKRVLGDRWRGSEPGLIVCNFDGSAQNKDTPSRQWRKFAAANGFEGVTFHNLRTSHATILLTNSIDITAVAGRMGHSDVTTTLRYYSMIVSKRDKQSAQVMDQMAHRAGLIAHSGAIAVTASKTEDHGTSTTIDIAMKSL